MLAPEGQVLTPFLKTVTLLPFLLIPHLENKCAKFNFPSLELFWNSHFISRDTIHPLDLVSSELLVI